MIPMLRLMTLCSSLLITILPAAAQVGNEPYTGTDTVASDIYLVGRGETLEDVARAYQLSTEQLFTSFVIMPTMIQASSARPRL